jgi:hypothetical protein
MKKPTLIAGVDARWYPDTQEFIAELADTSEEVERAVRGQHPVFIVNPKTNRQLQLFQTHADVDGNGEDVYGWNYKGYLENGQMINLLIIND